MKPFQPDDIFAIKWLSDGDISPDGSRVAFVVTTLDREADDYRSAVWVVESSGGEARQFTAGAKRDTAPRWSPDGRWLAFLSERGEEKAQVAVMPSAGGESRVLTKFPFGSGAPAWAPDSRRIAVSAKTGVPPDKDSKKAKPYRRITELKYRLNAEGFVYDRRRHLFVVDLEGGDPCQVTDGPWDDTGPAWSPDGTQIAFASARHDERDYDRFNDLWVAPASGGDARQVTVTNATVSAPAWSPDGTRLALVANREYPANSTLHIVDAAGGDPAPADPSFDRQTAPGAGAGQFRHPTWAPDGSLLSAAEDRGRMNLIRVKEGTTAWETSGDHLAGAVSFTPDGASAAFIASTHQAPAEVFLHRAGSPEPLRLTSLNTGFANDVSLVRGERFAVPVDGGVEVDCWVMKPAGFVEGQRYPVLLNIHGGPFGQYGENFFDEFQVYSGGGYGVVFCNPRGSSGQDTAFSRALVGDMGGVDYRDVMAAFDAALERMPWADRDRLGVLGGSYGGYMTCWIIGHDHRFKAACVERGAIDWYGMQGASDIGHYFNQLYLGDDATVHGNLERLLAQSPVHFAKEIQTPTLILHAEDDLRCPIAQSEQLFVILKLLRKDVEFVRFPDENHEMSRAGRPSHRVDRFEVILDFFNRKLAP